MSANIFISFAGQDLKVASTLCKALEGRGFQCWISSRDILPGENFQVAIVRAIRMAKMMLLVFTANSNNSEEMTKELALASQHKLIVVPLRIEDVAPNDAFAYEFATRQWIDFFADWETAMNQLSERIGNALSPEGVAAKEDAMLTPAARAAKVESAALASASAVALAEPPAARVGKAEELPASTRSASVETLAPPPARAPAAAPEPPPVAELKPPPARPATAPPAAQRPAAPPVKPPTPAPAAATAAAAPAKASGSRVGIYVAVALVVLLLIGVGLFAPSLFGPKPPSSAAVAAAAHAPPPAPVAAPAAIVAPPPVAAPTPTPGLAAAPATNALAPTNALAALTPKPKPKPKPHAAYSSGEEGPVSHGQTDVPF
jgi:hypothetical protein